MTPSPRIKICGITNVEDALQAAALGAEAIGLNFYPPSPRCLEPATAQAILRALPPFVEPVGLFVGTPLSAIVERLESLARIRTIQCYGEPRATGDPYPLRHIPAFNVRDADGLREITRYLEQCREHPPAAVLVDAAVPGQFGGTGQRAPWELLADFRPGVPLILAGGLTPENVAEAVRIVRPYAVDVASGVEGSPGRKDHERMRQFIEAVRQAS